MAGEGVLDQDHATRLLALAEASQRQWCGLGHAPGLEQLLEPGAGQPGAVDHAEAAGHQPVHQAVIECRVVGRSQRCQHRQHEFEPADQVVAQRAQVASVIDLEELGAKGRDIDLDRALAGAGLARQAAGHGVVDLVGKVVLAAQAVERAAGQVGEPA